MCPLTPQTLSDLIGGNTMEHIAGEGASNLQSRSHHSSAIDKCVAQYYRCPESYVRFEISGSLSSESGYFKFGNDVVCYGQLTTGQLSNTSIGNLVDTMDQLIIKHGISYLPFDPAQVANNLRFELYLDTSSYRSAIWDSAFEKLYYSLRPLMPVTLRKFLQKAWITNRNNTQFPQWPVDHTVDRLLEQLLLLSLRTQGVKRIPFIWFWPNGAPSCAIIGHDVETTVGRNFTANVMDLDDAHSIKSAFSIVPERRYEVSPDYLNSIWKRGFEVIVQGLNHDGNLFRDRIEYLRYVDKINAYGKQYGAGGFRSPVLYRNQRWFDKLQFSYDTSVPNVGHLEAQRGGCCTVMPYFVGNILELPVTTIQDYALFNYLNKDSIDLWKEQTDIIMNQHGLVNFIIHPDYITKPRQQSLYRSLLAHLVQLRDRKGLWIPTPREVDRWWRQRANMVLVEDRHGLRIEGEGSEQARIAYASEVEGKLVVSLDPQAGRTTDRITN